MPVIQEERRTSNRDPAFLLALLYTIGFYAFVLATVVLVIPPDNKDLVGQLLPVLSLIQGGIVNYFYTKSQQQAAERKDDAISKMADATKAAALSSPPPPPVVDSTTTLKVDNLDMTANNVDVHEGKP